MWYGDYLNLGAGAEIASYFPVIPGFSDAPGYWFDMGISLSSTEAGHEGEVFSREPSVRMWNNGFVPGYQKPIVNQLTATATLRFTEDQRFIYEAFKAQHQDETRDGIVIPDDKTHTIRIIL
jgi:hypothetical protein